MMQRDQEIGGATSRFVILRGSKWRAKLIERRCSSWIVMRGNLAVTSGTEIEVRYNKNSVCDTEGWVY
jgi:hypothetical protein